MKIISKFNGTCKLCNGTISAGDKVEWEKGQGTAHIVCPESKQLALPDPSVPTRVIQPKHTGLAQAGDVWPNSLFGSKCQSYFSASGKAEWEAFHGVEWLYVLSVKIGKEYDDDEERWRKTESLTCRGATVEESATAATEKAAKEQRARAEWIVEGLARSPWQSALWSQPETVASLPDGLKLGGERHDSNTWILAEDGSSWLAVYNGRDGDDWRGNNWGGHSRVWVARDVDLREWLLAAREVLSKE